MNQMTPCPVLIGADLNCYHVARAFFEEYGVSSYAFGRYEIGSTKASRFIHFTTVPDLDSDESFLCKMKEFAASHSETDGKRILIGCTDDYANLISRHKEELSSSFIIPYNPIGLMDELQTKERFYSLCEKYGIPYPKTVVFRKLSDICTEALSEEALGFSYPVIVKPANSVVYWKHPFDGMEKVYCAKTPERAEEILKTIFQSGYDDTILVQDMIPGPDCRMYVLTAYSDSEANVRMMCLGHVLLEEKTPKGKGNHTAIITEENRELEEKLALLLRELGYVGFSNFDIKYDERDGSFRAFEINLRQGRSNYYVTASGKNIAKLLVDDYLLHVPFTETDYSAERIFWSYVPKAVVYRYTKDPLLVKEAKSLCRAKKYHSSLWYGKDFRNNPRRIFYVAAQSYNQFRKFRKYSD